MRTLHGFLAFLLFVAAGIATGAPTVQANDAGKIDLTAHIETLRDPSGRLGFDEVRHAAGFLPLGQRLNLGFTRDAIWLRFTVVAVSGPREPRWLEVNSPLLDDVQLFLPRADGSVERRQNGDDHSPATRDMRYRNVTFRLNFDPGQTQTVYLRLQTRNSMTAAISLWRNDAFFESVTRESQVLGSFFGMALALLISGLCFYLYMRDSLHAWYPCYASAILTAGFGGVGWLHLYVLPPIPALADKVIGVAIALSMGCSATFYTLLLGTKSSHPRLAVVWQRFFWIAALAGCAGFLFGDYRSVAPLVQMTALTLIALVVPFALVRAMRRDRNALIFLVAFGPFTAAVAVRFLLNLGILPASVQGELAYLLGLLVHMLFLNVSFIDRYRQMRLALDAAQAETLAAAWRVERELDAKIAERTLVLASEVFRRAALEEELRGAAAKAETALAAERRVRAEQAEFVDMVSHEFRTPLTIIDTTAQMLQLTQPDAPAEIRHRLAKIESAADRLTELIDRYLTNDRLALDDSELTLQPCALGALLGEVVARARLRETGHGIDLRLPDEELSLTCDRPLMSIAIDNLLSNAIKYAPPGTTITVTAEHRETNVLISVNDKGSGIAAREHNTVFRKFIRGKNIAGTSGAGLGLYIVKRIVERNGGQVELDSEPGRGTTIALRFPRLKLA